MTFRNIFITFVALCSMVPACFCAACDGAPSACSAAAAAGCEDVD